MPMGGRPVASRNYVGAFVSVHPHPTARWERSSLDPVSHRRDICVTYAEKKRLQ